ncbi:putative membrane protein YkoI [Methanofollis sp. W23]|uniref:PepSY domain-containing protein n=1 Tax=Methanofollis sp. W23 TaxID=2817849 RepID=UPI001AE334BC|nr:PepSY domain-containing protein [Methanofollis sp. W23]MBP2144976.1 putative membrane protein YkoI [Methanofollis sp. W23]
MGQYHVISLLVAALLTGCVLVGAAVLLSPGEENQVSVQADMNESAASAIVHAAVPAAETPIQGTLVGDAPDARVWEFEVSSKEQGSGVIGIDAKTGEVVYAYGEIADRAGVNTGISMEEAGAIAGNSLKGEEVASTLAGPEVSYEPPHFAGDIGRYRVAYTRVIDGIPSLDGVTISIDPETGTVLKYHIYWDLPETIEPDPTPTLSAAEAGEILTAAMEERRGSEGMKVLSTELWWYDRGEGEQISLAWKVEFEDDSIRSYETDPASAWIDAHTGEELFLSYYLD